MKIYTIENPSDIHLKETLGMVYGNTIRSRHLGKDLLALSRIIVGGEIQEYTKLMAEAREQAIDRMIEMAQQKGADAIVGVRFASSVVATGASELLAYGTAIKKT